MALWRTESVALDPCGITSLSQTPLSLDKAPKPPGISKTGAGNLQLNSKDLCFGVWFYQSGLSPPNVFAWIHVPIAFSKFKHGTLWAFFWIYALLVTMTEISLKCYPCDNHMAGIPICRELYFKLLQCQWEKWGGLLLLLFHLVRCAVEWLGAAVFFGTYP